MIHKLDDSQTTACMSHELYTYEPRTVHMSHKQYTYEPQTSLRVTDYSSRAASRTNRMCMQAYLCVCVGLRVYACVNYGPKHKEEPHTDTDTDTDTHTLTDTQT